ncbi:TIR domain-containing protein [Erythrobacter citreus]|uniref:TIR domain-containing protein n=1 Tax=Qipengyuania citrea TaxID=225971 RepID=A0A6I4UDU9_9SPHN|nr:toll/interleukin-1 receptor domain-containing protein [Qipengyuania citrea]MDQ0565557.1 hypothetical protein [Qipengyuania citrea]MXP35433.1 TIR domain-containing protein [Qipengyuania citrea]
MARIFFSYSHADEALRDQLETQLALMKRQGLIETWHDRRIPAGNNFEHEISSNLESAEIVLLLVSPDFLASDYCYDIEMGRALERHKTGEAKVIPVILRACDWHGSPFGKLNAVPRDGRPITQWPDRDQAFLEVVKAIRNGLPNSAAKQPIEVKSASALQRNTVAVEQGPRSSNLRVGKDFTDRDKDKFKVEAFEYMAKFFANSLSELEERNEGIECDFRRLDGNRFASSIYINGNSVAKCTVFMGGDRYMGSGISFVHGETNSSNSYNESLAVQSDSSSMYLAPSGMAAMVRGEDGQRLTMQGASELYWALLMQPLQGHE